MKILSETIIAQAKTIHSISDREVQIIVDAVKHFKPNSFLDFGCHLGHLSIRLAIDFEMDIYAVDNFIGSNNDTKMKNTIHQITNGNGNFYYNLMKNIEEAEVYLSLNGNIQVYYSDKFFKLPDLKIDFAFIDSSHDSYEEFIDIDKLIPPGGILAGHDNTDRYERNQGVLKGIAMIEDNYEWIRNDFLFIMQKL